MAFSAPHIWEVRDTGNDANGGGFDPVSYSPGVDYSQQDSPQVVYTDLVIDAANALKLTSAANPFTAAHVGNTINITGGAGFTVQRVVVISVSAGVATVTCQGASTSCGTLGSTGGTGNLGGALATIQQAASLIVIGHKVYIKGTHTVTSTITINTVADLFLPVFFIGYSTNRTLFNTDTPPIITTATNSVNLITFNGAYGITFRNFKFTNSATTKGAAVTGTTVSSGATYHIIFERCIFGDFTDRLLYGFYVNATSANNVTARFYSCEFLYCTGVGAAYANQSNASVFIDCWFHDNVGAGILGDVNAINIRADRCIFSNNGTFGYALTRNTSNTAGALLTDCVFYNNTTAAYRHAGTSGSMGPTALINCIFYGIGANTNISFTAANRTDGIMIRNCAFGGSGAFSNQNCPTGEDAVILSADPFTNAAAGDFSLNTAAGGGALLRGIARTPWLNSGTTSYKDIGAPQHQDTGGSGSSGSSSLSVS